jgi:hypothetical protein
MTAERGLARVVRSWLREEEHESADRILETVLARLDTTPQRRSRWPARRYVPVNTQLKVLIAAAAVVVVALVGYQLLPRNTSVGGPSPTPAPTPSIAPSPSPSPSPLPSPTQKALVVPSEGPLAVGTHDLNLEGVHMTFAIAKPGWISNGIFGFDKPADKAGFIVWEDDADGIFSDPCSSTKAPPVGPKAIDMANAIAGMSSIELVAGPESFTIGGKPAQMVMVRMPDPLPCPNDQFYLWYDATIRDNARYASGAGNTVRVWIIEVDGKRIQLDGEWGPGAPASIGDELWAIVNSIQFD